MSENWLHSYLLESVRRDLCVTIYCTTCGAREFRLGVLKALAQAEGRQPSRHYDLTSATKIAKALSEAQPGERDK